MRIVFRVCIAVLIFCSLNINVLAMKNLGKYIQLEKGKSQIVLNVGDKERLNVNECLFGMPVYKGLSFSSSNDFIVSVDDSGFAYANMRGKAFITVTDSYGRSDSISVCVEGKRKLDFFAVLFIAAVFIASILLLKKIKSV